MANLRRIIQLAALCCFLALVFLDSYPQGFRYPAELFLRLDPYSAVGAMIAARSFSWWALPALGVLASALVVGRAFCGWFCPLGTMLDGFSTIFRLKPKPLRLKRLRGLKYGILAAALAAAALGATLVPFTDPLAIAERSGILVIRKSASTAIAALREHAASSGFVGSLASAPGLEDRFYSLAWIFAVLFAAIFALEFLNRRAWCRYACPLGALFSVVSRPALVRRLVSGCKSTDICKRACVFGAIGDDPRTVRAGECALCLRCRGVCPHGAIRFGSRPATSAARADRGLDERVSLERRAVAASLAAGAAWGLLPFGLRLSGAAARKPPLRPPGALPEHKFLAACSRCGACIGACLTGGLQPAWLEAGIEGLWSPVLVPRRGGCEAECNLCGKVCPSQAIRYYPLEEKKRLRMGRAVIDKQLCVAWKEERLCYICDEACPVGAIDFTRQGGQAPARSIDKPTVVAAKCTGCGLCEWRCPVDPRAIRVEPLGPQ